MQINRRLLVLFILLVSAAAVAQPDEDAAKEKIARLNAILEETLADVQNLRLPENRAVFYARIGNLMWPQDNKRARSLFQNAATELVNAQNLAESKRAADAVYGSYSELLQGGTTRQHILNLIASRDAELALELLVRTRPSTVQQALERNPEKSRKLNSHHQNNAHLAQNESYMEQNFYRMAAEQSPERAVKILKESLSKGLSNDSFNQLHRLAEKDDAAAAEMGSQVIDKLLRSSYMLEEQPNYPNIQLTQAILNHHMSRQNGDGNKLKFDDAQVRALASRFISTYVNDQRVAGAIGHSIQPIAEKFQPSSVEQIKKVTTRMYPQTGVSDLDAAYQKLMQSETTVQQMLAEADKFPVSTRRQIYQTASNKLLGQGDSQGARDILTEYFAEDDYTISNFDQQHVWNLINQGKFAEAERAIDGLPPQNRLHFLVNLANSVFHRDQKENRAYALALLGKARQLINEKPENTHEMGLLMQVIGGYSQIDPAEAIRLYEGVIPKVLELIDAAAILNGFQVNSNVREGEFLMLHGDPFSQYGGNPSMIGSFSRSDFDRTMNLIDSFSRKEMRISLRLQMLEGSEITTAVSNTIRTSVVAPLRARKGY
jgi:hypothetical protein